MSSKAEDMFAQAAGALMAAALMAAIWIVIKSAEVVVRALMLDPKNRVLWVAILNALLWSIVCGLTHWQSTGFIAVFGTSLLVVVAVAKYIEMCHDRIFQRELSKEMLIDDILNRPWFSP